MIKWLKNIIASFLQNRKNIKNLKESRQYREEIEVRQRKEEIEEIDKVLDIPFVSSDQALQLIIPTIKNLNKYAKFKTLTKSVEDPQEKLRIASQLIISSVPESFKSKITQISKLLTH